MKNTPSRIYSLIIVSTMLFTVQTYAAESPAVELPFDIFTVESKSYPRFETFDATIEATRKSTVSSETNGRVSEINFDIDEVVNKGSVLVRITAAATRAQLSGVEANVSEMQAQYDVALTEFNRIKDVYAKQLVSKSAFDKAEAELKAANERLSAAKARVKEVLAKLKYTVVKAPYSGVVAERHVELGEMVKVGQPLLTGYSQNELRAVARVPQSLVSVIRNTQFARIMINNKREEDLHSSSITVYPDADAASHSYKVRVQLSTAPKGVYPGHFVKVMFPSGSVNSIRVPGKTVVKRSELQAVYVVADTKISLRQVRLGNDDESGMVEILAGIAPGEKIAMDPVAAGILLKKNALKNSASSK